MHLFCMRVWSRIHVHGYWGQRTTWRVVSPFHHVGPRDWPKVIKPCSSCPFCPPLGFLWGRWSTVYLRRKGNVVVRYVKLPGSKGRLKNRLGTGKMCWAASCRTSQFSWETRCLTIGLSLSFETGSHSVAHIGLELTEICLLLPPIPQPQSAWMNG